MWDSSLETPAGPKPQKFCWHCWIGRSHWVFLWVLPGSPHTALLWCRGPFAPCQGPQAPRSSSAISALGTEELMRSAFHTFGECGTPRVGLAPVPWLCHLPVTPLCASSPLSKTFGSMDMQQGCKVSASSPWRGFQLYKQLSSIFFLWFREGNLTCALPSLLYGHKHWLS